MRIDELGSRWKEAYEGLMGRYQTKHAVAVARHYRPKKLYKFFSFDSQYWRRNIFHGDLVFNFPSSYNDPMDSRWFLDYERILRARYEEIGERWDDAELREFLRYVVPTYEEDLYYLRYLFQISCFSESPCSNLMWGHYGGKHRGFCVEYDAEQLATQFPLLLPVIYTKEPFQAWRLLDKRDMDQGPLVEITPYLYKSWDWAYEQEWRAILPAKATTQDATVLSLPACVTGIFLGLGSFPEALDEIEAWAGQRHVTIYQMERTYGSYDFVYDTLEDVRRGEGRGFIL